MGKMTRPRKASYGSRPVFLASFTRPTVSRSAVWKPALRAAVPNASHSSGAHPSPKRSMLSGVMPRRAR